jgi:Na+/H+-translocating membrane pyrophosphatase
MSDIDIPPEPKLQHQLITIALVMIAVSIVLAIFAKFLIAFIIFLLAAITGAFGQNYKNKF